MNMLDILEFFLGLTGVKLAGSPAESGGKRFWFDPTVGGRVKDVHNFINPFLLQRNTIAFCYLNLVLGIGGGKICAISRKNSFKSHRPVCLGCCKNCTNSPNFVNIFSFLR